MRWLKSSFSFVTRVRPAALLVLAYLLLAAAIVAGSTILLSNLRDRALLERGRELNNVVLMLGEQTDRAILAVGLLEASLIERMQAQGVASAEDYERAMSGHDVHLMLKDKVSG